MESEIASTSEEQFVRLFAANERHLRGFVRSTGLGWTEVDDVIQTVSLVMWRKWDQFDPESDFMRWARVIARFEVLKARRKFARDRHIFRDDLQQLLADAAEEQFDETPAERYHEALAGCLDTLPEKSRELIAMAYQGDQTIRELAGEVGKSATALYKTLDRIRKTLGRCIEKRLEEARP
ncbi:MAG: RNA polymerase sigma-70 factor (ECF subfamily) [Verrucomicrobiales bacterium]|jgi:RNA polymerase sigma-70 factor (ECF subfamily)